MHKILIIEDEEEILDNISDLLEAEGFEVACADNGNRGIELAKKQRPDLIICDIMMPVMDGHAVLRRIRTDPVLMTVPFIFLTARSERSDQRHGMVLGADDYLTKPFSTFELLEAIKTQISKKGSLKRQYARHIEDLRANLTRIFPHELRTPLVSVIGFTQLLKDRWQSMDPHIIHDMLDHILAGGYQLERLVENYGLYTYLTAIDNNENRRDEIHTSPTPAVKALIEKSAFDTANRVDRSNDLLMNIRAGSVKMDEHYVTKIVIELVDNACKFSHPGTPIRIHGKIQKNNYVLEIADKGCGFEPEQIDGIGAFIQFNRDKNEQQGSGLGLSLVKLLAERNN